MAIIEFDEEKNIFLKQTRGVSFEDVLEAIKKGDILDDIENPKRKYARQRIYVVRMKRYVYAVPYVKSKEGSIFLKTVYPSRKLAKLYSKR